MNFASDNWAGVHPAISQTLAAAGNGFASPYGTSALDKQLEQRFNELFEREVAVFFVATGTAANSLALSAVNRPGGVCFAHRDAHMLHDECGAPEFFTQGARLVAVDGSQGKLDPHMLKAAIQAYPADFVHAGQPMAVSITQATEVGSVYQTDQIAAIAKVAQDFGLPLHMDGARFANALVSLQISPAEMTWRQGVDMVSFGATKNGCWCAEALVFLNPELIKDFAYLRKRSGQLFSKSRFIASQFNAYFENNLWLELAASANQMAGRLSQGIVQSKHATLAWQTEANEVFCIVDKTLANHLQAQGALFYFWQLPKELSGLINPQQVLLRLVTSFATETAEVDQFLSLLN